MLLIDDDVELCGLLREFLKREGFSVDVEHEGRRGLERAAAGGWDLVILDVMLPGMDGFAILRELRKRGRTPILMLTARGEDVDRIVGLELGADDYLAKPFNPRELAARIRAILRRTEPQAAERGPVEVNGVTLDPASREVAVDGQQVEVTTLRVRHPGDPDAAAQAACSPAMRSWKRCTTGRRLPSTAPSTCTSAI